MRTFVPLRTPPLSSLEEDKKEKGVLENESNNCCSVSFTGQYKDYIRSTQLDFAKIRIADLAFRILVISIKVTSYGYTPKVCMITKRKIMK